MIILTAEDEAKQAEATAERAKEAAGQARFYAKVKADSEHEDPKQAAARREREAAERIRARGRQVASERQASKTGGAWCSTRVPN